MASAAIVVVAYEAESTITDVLDRIPPNVARRIGAIFVSDDGSSDQTTAEARRWATKRPEVRIDVVRQPRNLGYGGNQRVCYAWAQDKGFDHVVMLHGDGQYAPELVASILEPLLVGDADAVFGSRMLSRNGARRGGMPAYKRVGNRVLTAVQNRLTGLELSEWHSGYRAYSTAMLRKVDMGSLSSDFDFDTQIILALHRNGARFHEIAIPTFYGDEKCRVNGLRYAGQVVREVVRHRRLTPAAA